MKKDDRGAIASLKINVNKNYSNEAIGEMLIPTPNKKCRGDINIDLQMALEKLNIPRVINEANDSIIQYQGEEFEIGDRYNYIIIRHKLCGLRWDKIEENEERIDVLCSAIHIHHCLVKFTMINYYDTDDYIYSECCLGWIDNTNVIELKNALDRMIGSNCLFLQTIERLRKFDVPWAEIHNNRSREESLLKTEYIPLIEKTQPCRLFYEGRIW